MYSSVAKFVCKSSLAALFLVTRFEICSAVVKLDILSNFYLPWKYNNDTPQFGYGYPSTEQISIDEDDKIIYATGIDIIHVIDFSDVTELKILHSVEKKGYETTDVEYCGKYVFVTMDNLIDKENGKVLIFYKYDRESKKFDEYQTMTVGSLPDMVKPNSDCTQAVVAIEGEPYPKDGSLIDPEGAIGIINFDEKAEPKFSYNHLDFRSYNSREEELMAMGIRKSHPKVTMAQDLEPEYITFNDDHSVAYVGLQENNAIAEIDMKEQKINKLYPLGYKKWTESSFDASFDDEAINLKPWPVYALYQPDSIHYTKFRGMGYILTANEGDERHYMHEVNDGYTDVITGQHLAQDSELLDLPLELISELRNNRSLGHLRFSNADGINKLTGKYEKLFMFGGRSFSVIRADTMDIVYDSGNDAEKKISELYPYLFNGDIEGNLSPAEQKDLRSVHKGPEVESLAVAEIGNETIIFIGCERPGIIGIYTVTDDITKPVFNGMWSHIPNSPLTYQQLYDARRISAIDPEDIRFIPASKSPNNKNLLMVSGTDSGTISILEVKVVEEKEEPQDCETDSAEISNYASIYWHICLLLVAYFST